MRALTLVALICTAAVVRAEPPIVYLNGVKLEAGSLKDVVLKNCEATFDARGELHLVAPDYKITLESQAPTPPLGGRHYYAVTHLTGRDRAAQWEVAITVNGSPAASFRSRVRDVPAEITRFLKPGANTVHLRWRKEPGDRASTSADDALELMIGQGNYSGGQMQLAASITQKHTAAETGVFESDLSLFVPPK
jgi:hypothetical protein